MFSTKFAACRGYPTDYWFPYSRLAEGVHLKEVRDKAALAKALCRNCSLRVECLEYAQSVPEEHGIWGGLDENERGFGRRKRVI